MRIYVNPGNGMFQVSLNSQIYVDKTGPIEYTNSVLNTDVAFICSRRIRRSSCPAIVVELREDDKTEAAIAEMRNGNYPNFSETTNVASLFSILPTTEIKRSICVIPIYSKETDYVDTGSSDYTNDTINDTINGTINRTMI